MQIVIPRRVSGGSLFVKKRKHNQSYNSSARPFPQIPRVHDFEAIRIRVQLHHDFVLRFLHRGQPRCGPHPTLHRVRGFVPEELHDDAFEPARVVRRVPRRAGTRPFGPVEILAPVHARVRNGIGVPRRPHARKRPGTRNVFLVPGHITRPPVPAVVHAVVLVVELDYAPGVRVVVPRHGAVLPDPEPVGAVELKVTPDGPSDPPISVLCPLNHVPDHNARIPGPDPGRLRVHGVAGSVLRGCYVPVPVRKGYRRRVLSGNRLHQRPACGVRQI
mmetsp:Transcript_13253/g.49532  ORF Transcript_13253/g.49532 Transcript_13253/m.49532 type:complete len:274 (+) Transcript_13253:606-1427(+)